MNLLANAIDALDESIEGRSFPEIAANPNRIKIKICQKVDFAVVKIADNGTGMPPEVKTHLRARIYNERSR